MIAPPKPTRQALAAWLAELPLGNPDYCADAIRTALETFNGRKDIPPATKSELAELMRPVVLGLVQRAAPYFTDARLPYAPEVLPYASRGLELHGALVRAYIPAALRPRPLESAGAAIDPRFPDLFRGLQHHGLVLLSISQLYRSPPPEYWSILYRLYRIAENQGLLSLRFEDGGEPEACQTPLGLFKRILLFYLADTTHLRQKEMGLVYELLGNVADSALFSAQAEMDERSAEYCLCLDGDGPPEPLRSPAGPTDHHHDERYLYARQLAKSVLGTVFGSTAGKEATVSRTSATRIAKTLRGAMKRRWNRAPETGTCRLIIGLSSLVRALAPAEPEPAEVAPETPEETIDALLTSDLELENLERGWEPGLESGRSEMRNEADLKELMLGRYRDIPIDIWGKKSTVPPTGGAPSEIEISILNSGPQGYCLSHSTDLKSWAKVGEVVGVSVPHAAINAGVVRWMQVEEDQRLELGVELLAPNAEVVEIMELGITSKGHALLLPGNRFLRNPPEILLAPGAHPSGEILEVHSSWGRRLFRIHETIETTPSFYRYSLMEVVAKAFDS